MYKWKINLIKSAISKLWSHTEYLCRTFCTKSQFVYPCNIEIWFKRSSLCWCYDTRDISKDLTFNLVMNNALNFGRRFICETRKEINVFSFAMLKLKHGKVTLFCVDIAAAFNSCMWGHNLLGVSNYAKNVNWKKITTTNPTIHSHLFSNGSVIFYRSRVKFFLLHCNQRLHVHLFLHLFQFNNTILICSVIFATRWPFYMSVDTGTTGKQDTLLYTGRFLYLIIPN